MVEEGGPDIGTLCKGCGACCNWVLFRSVALAPPEVDWAKRRGLPIMDGDSGVVMPIPCAAHASDLSCSVYDERPATCRRFECDLVKRVRRGEVTMDEALTAVRELRDVASRVERRVAPGRPASEVAAALVGLSKVAAPGSTHDDVDLLLDVGVRGRMARRHFVTKMKPI